MSPVIILAIMAIGSIIFLACAIKSRCNIWMM